MYVERLRTLKKAFSSVNKANAAYKERQQLQRLQDNQLSFLNNLHTQAVTLGNVITQKECEWREAVLSVLESEIINDLAYVYPSDGYTVKLSSKISRRKIHIDVQVGSIYVKNFQGKIKSTQGRLFQQVVSFAALVGVMTLLGVKTLYVDEAFSGSAKQNIRRLNSLLMHLRERGYNLIIIAQDTTLAENIGANRLFLSRDSGSNVTTIMQEVEEPEYE